MKKTREFIVKSGNCEENIKVDNIEDGINIPMEIATIFVEKVFKKDKDKIFQLGRIILISEFCKTDFYVSTQKAIDNSSLSKHFTKI